MEIESNQSHLQFFLEACQMFFPQKAPIKFYQLKGGLNNWTKIVEYSEGKFVVRIYNNGKNLEKVRLEHQIMVKLQNIKKSFQTPSLVKKNNGETLAILKGGHPCCMMKVIQGQSPKQFSQQGLENFGKSLAQLTNIMQNIKLSKIPINKSLFHLYQVHESMNKQIFFREILSEKYDDVRESVNKILQYSKIVQQKIQQFKKLNFPIQLIHGDLLNSNILMKDDQVTALLDFQFLAFDWRAMDLGISLSKFINKQNSDQMIKNFMTGYKQVGKLTAEQMRSVPWMIAIRLIAGCVYFVGRVYSGQQDIELSKKRISINRKRLDNLIPRIESLQKLFQFQPQTLPKRQLKLRKLISFQCFDTDSSQQLQPQNTHQKRIKA